MGSPLLNELSQYIYDENEDEDEDYIMNYREFYLNYMIRLIYSFPVNNIDFVPPPRHGSIVITFKDQAKPKKMAAQMKGKCIR